MLAGLVFDFDGLILDTEWPEYHAVATIFDDHGLRFAAEDWVHVIGSSWNVDWVAELETRLGRGVDAPELQSEKRRRKQLLHEELEILPGVMELLDEAAAAGVPLAVASSSPRSWVEGHLVQFGLLDRFVAVRTLDDVAEAKPAPDLYLAACLALDVDPARSIALEDSRNGTIAAKRAGMRCVAVPNRLTVLLDHSEADLVVASLCDVSIERLQRLVRDTD